MNVLVHIRRRILTILSVSNTQTINLTAGGAFIIQNASGSTLAAIDSTGTMNIKGTLTQNTEPPTADVNDFILQNSSGGYNLVITCRKLIIFEHLENL